MQEFGVVRLFKTSSKYTTQLEQAVVCETSMWFDSSKRLRTTAQPEQNSDLQEFDVIQLFRTFSNCCRFEQVVGCESSVNLFEILSEW